MSALRIDIDVSKDVAEDLQRIAAGLADKTPLHARIAADAETFVKARGRETAATEHRSAERLGATPTGHLVDAYEAIEGQSSEDGATLLVPGASRLRAAFGAYTVKPTAGKYYLTIPVAKDSYGKRAGEFGDELFFTRVGPKRQAVLARRQERADAGSIQGRSSKGKRYDNTKPLEVLYVLVTEATIPEDRGLIPFDDLAAEAVDTTEAYLDELTEGGLA